MTQCLQSAPENARILIVDDHPIVREGMAMFLNQQSNLFVCCMAENAADAMTRICTHRHDLAIVDMSLNRDSGLDLIASIRHQSADIGILVISIAHRLLDSGSTRATSAPRISERESEVLHLLGLGFSTLEIAQIQNRSIKTIETQLASLKTKLRIKSGRDLIRHAIQIEETR